MPAYDMETCLSVPNPSSCLAKAISQSHFSTSDHVQRVSRNSSNRRIFISCFHDAGQYSVAHLLEMFRNWVWCSNLQLSTWGRSVHCWLMISLPPVAIPLKSELAYEIFDKGQVRFWLQAEHLSPDASFRFVINDREVSDSEVSSWMWAVAQRYLDLLSWEWAKA